MSTSASENENESESERADATACDGVAVQPYETLGFEAPSDPPERR